MKTQRTDTPMEAFGSVVILANNIGGFDLRGCLNAEDLAAFIVRACNAHDDLVAALIEVRDNGMSDSPDMWRRVDLALAKAGAA